MLGNDIHAHKGQPRDQYAAVQRDPIQLQKRFIGKQIHADDADRKQGYHSCGDGAQQNLGFFERSFDIGHDVPSRGVVLFLG